MRQDTITLPSGCSLTLRQITLAEENLLVGSAKAGAKAQDRVLNDVLNACAVRVEDVGPYTHLQVGGKPQWDDMLAGDRFAALVELRILSYREREKYNIYGVACINTACKRKTDYIVDLRNDLLWRSLDEDDRLAIAQKKPHTVTIDNRQVLFTPHLCRTDTRFTELEQQHPDRAMAALLAARIINVADVPQHDLLDWLDGNNGKSTKYPGLTSEDAEELRDAYHLHNCGIDTDIELMCPGCQATFTISLPFDSGFLLPGKKIRDRKAAMRRGTGSSGS